jgi:hypothetical protein
MRALDGMRDAGDDAIWPPPAAPAPPLNSLVQTAVLPQSLTQKVTELLQVWQRRLDGFAPAAGQKELVKLQRTAQQEFDVLV